MVVQRVEVDLEPPVGELLLAQKGEQRVGQGEFLARTPELLEALFESPNGLREPLAGRWVRLVPAAPGLEEMKAVEVLSVETLAAEGLESGPRLFDFGEGARDIEELDRGDFLEGRGGDLPEQKSAGGEAEVAGGSGEQKVGQGGYDFHQDQRGTL